MPTSEPQQSVRSDRRRRVSGSALAALAAVLVLAASVVALALAAGSTVTVNTASNAALGETVLVNPQGRTLYALSPETAGHLLCRSSECLKFWPPFTVPSGATKLKAGSSVHGRLGILRRSNGMLQVTLRGLPLYRFLKDHAKGEANGQGIVSFGGTWHAVTATGGASHANAPAPAAAGPTQAPSPPSSPSPPSGPSTPAWGY